MKEIKESDVSEQMGDLGDLDRLIRIKERTEEATTTRCFAAADQFGKKVRTYKQDGVQLRKSLLHYKKKKGHKSYIQKQQPARV